jgi:Lrp/AsnC family transcriptional regulator
MLDKLDVKILAALQDDASRPVAEIADAVGLSKNACWRRIKALEDADVVSRGAALIDPSAVGLGVTVFVALRTSRHDDVWLKGFINGLKAIPEVVEFYRLSGEVDYLLKVLVSDIGDYDRVYKRMITAAPLTDVSSSFAMETIKSTTALPLDRIAL